MLSSIARSFNYIPITDCINDKTKYIIAVELPGVKKEDVSISAENHEVTVDAKKNDPFKDLEKNYQSRRTFGDFKLVLDIPTDGDLEQINAALAEGVLTLTIPKTAKKQVKVNVA